MRIKLSLEEMTRLHYMIEYFLNAFPAGDPAEELIDALVKKIKIRIRNRLDHKRVGYSITLPKEEALAFEFWMSQIRLVVPKLTFGYELNTATQITNEINRIYG